MMNFIHYFKFCIKNVLQSTIKKSRQTLVLAKSAYKICTCLYEYWCSARKKETQTDVPSPITLPSRNAVPWVLINKTFVYHTSRRLQTELIPFLHLIENARIWQLGTVFCILTLNWELDFRNQLFQLNTWTFMLLQHSMTEMCWRIFYSIYKTFFSI